MRLTRTKAAVAGLGLALSLVACGDAGEIVEVAPPEEFFRAPQSDRAKAFLRRILSH